MQGKKILNHNAKRSLIKGLVIGILTIIIYLLVVVFTTPNLSGIDAINAAFRANSIIIIGLGIGIGAQMFISTYSKGLGCSINNRKGILSGGTGSTALSSFFSFFSLVPLGCCGSWLLILSFLPSIFGSTVSVILIEYSKTLSYVGLAVVFGFTALSAYKLRKRLQQEKRLSERAKTDSQIKGIGTLVNTDE